MVVELPRKKSSSRRSRRNSVGGGRGKAGVANNIDDVVVEWMEKPFADFSVFDKWFDQYISSRLKGERASVLNALSRIVRRRRTRNGREVREVWVFQKVRSRDGRIESLIHEIYGEDGEIRHIGLKGIRDWEPGKVSFDSDNMTCQFWIRGFGRDVNKFVCKRKDNKRSSAAQPS